MKSRYKYAVLLSVGAAALAQSSVVMAQTESSDEPQVGIADIVVTARRRSEMQQSVPQTISTVTPEEIERRGLRSTEDLARAVPGVNIGGQRRDEAQFNIRGQGPGPITTGQRNFTSVATYFAEVPATVAGPGVFYDLQNVEVLKGPQGTLFGRNTTGGAVLFEPHHPEYKNNGYAKVTLGNYDYKEFEGVVNVAPVPDKVAIRLAGQVSRRDGYTKSAIGQDLDERNYEALRASLQLNPTDSIDSLTIVDYRYKDNNGGSAILRDVNPGLTLGAPISVASINGLLGLPTNTSVPLRLGGTVNIACIQTTVPDSIKGLIGCPNGAFGYTVASYGAAANGGVTTDPANSGFYLLAPTSQIQGALTAQQALGARRTLISDRLRSKSLDLGITNKTSMDVTDTITLKNIIAFRKTRKNEDADYDGTPLPIINNLFAPQPWATGNNQFTEEFQVQGRVPSANLSYIVGAYYERVTTGFDQAVVGYTLGRYNARVSHFKDTSKALFGHIEWNPIDLIGFAGGIRQTWDKRFVSFSSFAIDGSCNQVDPQTGGYLCPQEGSAKFDALSYDATVNIKPMDRVLVYGSYRHGYKSGGINLPTPIPSDPSLPRDAYRVFGPESVDSFEVGLKADWFIGVPVRTNIALFYDKYNHMQVSVPTVVENQPPTNVVRNDVQATNKGVEFEGTIVPFKDLTISGFVSYLDASADETYLDDTGIPVVVAGRQFASQPKWTYGVSGVLNLPVSPDVGSMSLSANWSWRDKVFNTNSPALTLVPEYPSYGLLSARFDWNDIFGKNIDVGVFANNLLNKTYIQGGYPIAQLGFDAVTYGEPRMYGATLTVHFGER
jgi:iron complex outermembrane receptor protein